MTQVDRDGTPFELLPQDLRTHLGDFARAVEIAVSVSNIDSNEESYWIKQRECIERIKGQIAAANTDPWSTDLEAAPLVSVERIRQLQQAVAPLVAIADAYDASGLDEVRPEWGIANPGAVELYSGRGGKRLLTLADCLKARGAVR